MIFDADDMTVMDLILLLAKKGFREIEPCYFTLCVDFSNYFIYVNPIKPLFILYVLNENNEIEILQKDTIVEFFYQDINKKFMNLDYFSHECHTERFLGKVWRHEELPDYHIKE
jgi:hypothetical protein